MMLMMVLGLLLSDHSTEHPAIMEDRPNHKMSTTCMASSSNPPSLWSGQFEFNPTRHTTQHTTHKHDTKDNPHS